MAKKKDVKPIPVWLGLTLVVIAFAVMGSFLVYLISPPESSLGNGDISAHGSFQESENSDPSASYGEIIDIGGNESDPAGLKINAEINDILVFGSYNNQPIQWIVVDKQGEELLLLSRDCIDIRPYHSERTSVSWIESDLSKWLCGEFYNDTFNQQLKELVIDSQEKGKVFLLSAEEMNKYFEYDSWKRAYPTKELKEKYSLKDGKALCQWLRDSGNIQNSAAYVYFDGSVRLQGYTVDYNEVGVRPAMWIKTGYEISE